MHYAAGPLRDTNCDQTPVHCIVVQDADGRQTVFCAFSDAPCENPELELLDRFSVFVDKHLDYNWLCWGGGDDRYGPMQIAQRHSILGGTPNEIPANHQINLPAALKIIYGAGFADHPRLPSLLAMNGCSISGILSNEELIKASAQRDVAALRRDVERKVRGLFEILVLHNKGELKTKAASPQPPTPLPAPVQLLTSWRDILITLGKRNNDKERQVVGRLNQTCNGPIKIPGQGRQPLVDKAELIGWWNHLTVMAETQNRTSDTKASVDSQYDYARGGKVVPNISGEVKKRRKDRRS
jgi:hypothetical protein